MRKTKNVFAILAVSLGVIGLALLLLWPLFTTDISFSNSIIATGEVDSILVRLTEFFKFSFVSNFSVDTIMLYLLQYVALIGCGIGVVLFITLFILMLCKKHAKGLGWWFPMLIVFVGSMLVVGISDITLNGTHKILEPFYPTSLDMFTKMGVEGWCKFSSLVLTALAAVCTILAVIFYMVYVCKDKKVVDVKPAEKEFTYNYESPEAAKEAGVEVADGAAVIPEKEAPIVDAKPAEKYEDIYVSKVETPTVTVDEINLSGGESKSVSEVEPEPVKEKPLPKKPVAKKAPVKKPAVAKTTTAAATAVVARRVVGKSAVKAQTKIMATLNTYKADELKNLAMYFKLISISHNRQLKKADLVKMLYDNCFSLKALPNLKAHELQRVAKILDTQVNPSDKKQVIINKITDHVLED